MHPANVRMPRADPGALSVVLFSCFVLFFDEVGTGLFSLVAAVSQDQPRFSLKNTAQSLVASF